MASTLLVGASLGLVVAAAYLGVGLLVARRALATARKPILGLAAFWIGVGVYALAEAAWVVSHLVGLGGGLALGLVVLHVKIVAMSAAFAGLVGHLLYVYTGRPRWVAGALAYYAAMLVALEAFYAWRGPVDVAPGTWGLGLRYAQASVEPWWTLLLLALLLPALGSAIAYGRLVRVAKGRALRLRIRLTSASLVLFFAPTLVAWRAGTWYAWPVVEKLLGLVAAAGMLGAALVAAREGRPDAEGLATGLDAERAERLARLRQRARDLV